MKLYIDLTSFMHVQFLSGIQRVVSEVVIRLIKQQEFNVVLFTLDNGERIIKIIRNTDFIRFYEDNEKNKCTVQTERKRNIPSVFQSGDVCFDLDYVSDSCCRSRDELYPLLAAKGVRIVPYIYDVLPVMHPEFWGSMNEHYVRYLSIVLVYADKVLTSVQCTVRQLDGLAQCAGFPAANARVTWLGSDFKTARSAGFVSEKVKKVVSSGKYILCVGTLEPRKNHRLLLDAYDAGLAEMGINLVFAGRRGWGVDGLLKRIDEHPKKDCGLYFLEGENDASVAYLYENAYIVAFPTFDEGFGLPVVEALKHGAVVATSDIPVMREVGGEYCAYFSPQDPCSFVSFVKELTGGSNNTKATSRYQELKQKVKSYKPVLWDDVVKTMAEELLSVSHSEKQYSDGVVDVNLVTQALTAQAESNLRKAEFAKPFDADALVEALETMRGTYNLYLNEPVEGKGLKRFVKRCVRRLVRAAFARQIDAQRKFNAAALRAVRELGIAECKNV